VPLVLPVLLGEPVALLGLVAELMLLLELGEVLLAPELLLLLLLAKESFALEPVLLLLLLLAALSFELVLAFEELEP
jgi:hypothetical protein